MVMIRPVGKAKKVAQSILQKKGVEVPGVKKMKSSSLGATNQDGGKMILQTRDKGPFLQH